MVKTEKIQTEKIEEYKRKQNEEHIGHKKKSNEKKLL